MFTLHINTAELNTSCSCNGRICSFLSFAIVDKERSGKICFAARLWILLILFLH